MMEWIQLMTHHHQNQPKEDDVKHYYHIMYMLPNDTFLRHFDVLAPNIEAAEQALKLHHSNAEVDIYQTKERRVL